jgi:limonene-1,2-epoxide hydrolase
VTIDQHAVFGEDEDVCIVYDLVLEQPVGAIPTACWYKVEDGKVVLIRAFFNSPGHE